MSKNEIVLAVSHYNDIKSKILTFRGSQVMIDRDLAELYGVETRVLNQAVKRNIDRFPQDFMFQLTKSEVENWMSQIVISNKEKMGMRKMSSQHSTAQHSTAQHSTAQHSTAQHSTAQHSTAQHS